MVDNLNELHGSCMGVFSTPHLTFLFLKYVLQKRKICEPFFFFLQVEKFVNLILEIVVESQVFTLSVELYVR